MAKIYVRESKDFYIVDGYARKIEDFAKAVDEKFEGEGTSLLMLDINDWKDAPISDHDWFFTWEETPFPRKNYYVLAVSKYEDKIMNMSYCRFQNTFEDLIDCKDALYNGDIERTEEKRYAKKLIALCKEIVENFEDEDLD